jgi:hypothetical protein
MTQCDQVVEYMLSTDTATARQIAEHFGWPIRSAQQAVWKSMGIGAVEKVDTIHTPHWGGMSHTAVYRANGGHK